MGPDTQSSINAISAETYNKLQPKPILEPNNSLVYSYDSDKPMKSIGKFDTIINGNNRSIKAEIMVFENVRDNILSFESCMSLQIYDQLFNQLYSISMDDRYKEITSKYIDVFTSKIGNFASLIFSICLIMIVY